MNTGDRTYCGGGETYWGAGISEELERAAPPITVGCLDYVDDPAGHRRSWVSIPARKHGVMFTAPDATWGEKARS